jgi:hypothetical protein
MAVLSGVTMANCNLSGKDLGRMPMSLAPALFGILAKLMKILCNLPKRVNDAVSLFA